MVNENVSMESKIYVLQKDLPSVKAGVKYEVCCDNNTGMSYYKLMKEDECKVYDYPKECGIRYGGYLFDAQVVENNPEWFKLLVHNYPIDYTIPSKYLSNIPTIKTATWARKSLTDILTERQLITEKLQWYKKLSAKLDAILEYEDVDVVLVQLLLYYRKINNKIKKLELDSGELVHSTSWCNDIRTKIEDKNE